MLAHPCSFDLHHYEFILRRALHLGYRNYTHYDHVMNGAAAEPFVLLRHVIDFSLKQASPMVRLEHSLGIRSTIFVRVHSCGYNVFDLDNYAILRQFRQWGCEIALHYEPLFILLTREDPLRLVKRAKRMLEYVLDEPVYGLISHAPRLSPLLKNIESQALSEMGFIYNGSHPSFNRDNFYISDANRRWRRGCPCKHLGSQKRVTLLIHPHWWQPMSQRERYGSIDLLRQGR